jgi:hypothetical protein
VKDANSLLFQAVAEMIGEVDLHIVVEEEMIFGNSAHLVTTIERVWENNRIILNVPSVS